MPVALAAQSPTEGQQHREPDPADDRAVAIGKQIHGSVANGIRLSMNGVEPALSNTGTAWNTPRSSSSS